ncbi:MAG: sigma 54-interacting transcriptional regulator [Proteobacteria bacterium]|nr:sigma 54-interacting transcriptional regulator [Pseudomonadota bacterium]
MVLPKRYELVELLGRGGFGEVYLARDRAAQERLLALKWLPTAADRLIHESFEREFSTMASISLAGVARVHDFGVAGDAGATPFFTRDFVPGTSLAEADRLDDAQRIEAIVRAATTVAPLHRVGVIHGDLKPGNLILDANGDLHVIDFGLARIMHHRDKPYERSGTVSFMAPELFEGKAIDVQSDVYALGATLWVLLVAAPPFAELGARALEAKLAGERPKAPARLSPSASRALEVAWHAMRPDPLDRLATVDEFAAALAGLTNAPVAAVARGFVPPRPRGHGRVLEVLESHAVGAHKDAAERQVLLLEGPPGSGKSTLLRELKWRLQVRGFTVLEITACEHDPFAAAATLLRQADLLSETGSARQAHHTLERLQRAERVEACDLAAALHSLLDGSSGARGCVVLIDDLDLAEGWLGTCVRYAVHDATARPLPVIATATDKTALGVRELGARETLHLAPLSAHEVSQLVTDVLGPVDESVTEALIEHSGGLPAEIVDALAELSTRRAPSATDVRSLPSGQSRRLIAQRRLAAVSSSARRLLEILATVGGALAGEQLDALAMATGLDAGTTDREFPDRSVSRRLLEQGERAGLVVRAAERVMLADKGVLDVLLQQQHPAQRARLTRALLTSKVFPTLPSFARACIVLACPGETDAANVVSEAARELTARDAHTSAAQLYERLAERQDGLLSDSPALALAGLRNVIGEYEKAAELFEQVLVRTGASVVDKTEAALGAARAFNLQCKFDEAVQMLARVPVDAQATTRARVFRELARNQLRRGDYAEVDVAVEKGLACAAEDDPVRIELLGCAALVASYRGEHTGAQATADKALDLARRIGTKSDLASAQSCLAIIHQRAGQLEDAERLYRNSIEIADQLGDSGSMASGSLNLGTVLFLRGRPAEAAAHYEGAAKLARRAGRTPSELTARSNLAQLHIYLGLYERARLELRAIGQDAESVGMRLLAGQVADYQGDLAARKGDLSAARERYDEAVARFEELGLRRELAEAQLDAAEALLDLGSGSDMADAGRRLALARDLVKDSHPDDLVGRQRLLAARLELRRGSGSPVLGQLEQLLTLARHKRDFELEWQVLAAVADYHDGAAASFLAGRFSRLAREALQRIASTIPVEQREAFWHDPRRRRVRERANAAREPSGEQSSSGRGRQALDDPRIERLLESIRNLACELELDRLLERITESAVELSGAERGLLLLTGDHDELTLRTAKGGSDVLDAHAAFSRSIAEAVLIDGEPIVSVDARGDERFSEYMSVHHLMLRSVACMPIRGRKGVVGVLYLEHRRRAARFSDADVELLSAFADQAAIAIENARLHQENSERSQDVARINRALEQAKAEIELLLEARTSELEEAQRELMAAKQQAAASSCRHGIVGSAAAMRPVFDAIDRLAQLAVPVVVRGESGTGKELVARALHYAGPRAKGPFVVVNCASIPDSLLESELFGHTRGAFTGAHQDRQGLIARASGGTLVLDEMGDMPLRMQVSLLRVLQEGTVQPVGAEREKPVDVRFIACSNRPLKELLGAGRLREDLYYRLSVVEIALPPLRDRLEDVPLLCAHFLRLFAKGAAASSKRLSSGALHKLCGFSWPGNVRQLEHVLLSASVLANGSVIEPDDIAIGEAGSTSDEARQVSLQGASTPLRDRKVANIGEHKQRERESILEALRASGWNRAKAAKMLQMPRRTFYRRLRQYEIL